MTTHNETITQHASASASARTHVDSGSDQRVINNVQRIKDKGLEFHQLVAALGSSRELSIAQTKIEEAVMWAVKHITK